jgi:hypothetical protein
MLLTLVRTRATLGATQLYRLNQPRNIFVTPYPRTERDLVDFKINQLNRLLLGPNDNPGVLDETDNHKGESSRKKRAKLSVEGVSATAVECEQTWFF